MQWQTNIEVFLLMFFLIILFAEILLQKTLEWVYGNIICLFSFTGSYIFIAMTMSFPIRQLIQTWGPIISAQIQGRKWSCGWKPWQMQHLCRQNLWKGSVDWQNSGTLYFFFIFSLIYLNERVYLRTECKLAEVISSYIADPLLI